MSIGYVARRRKWALNVDVEFFVVAALVFLVTVESFVVGWAFHKAVALSAQWERPDSMFEFLKLLAFISVPMIAFNAVIGTYVARRLSRPLDKMRQAMQRITRGDLEEIISIHPDEFLRAYLNDCNKMMETLRRLIYRDRDYVLEANDLLTQCQHEISRLNGAKSSERDKMEHWIKQVKSRLSVINEHFLKGKKD